MQHVPDAVFVTGGAGFIGSALSSHLADMGRPVVAIDNLLPQVHPEQARPAALPDDRVELVVADVTHPGTWDELLTRYRPSLLVHLAAETGTAQSLTESTRHAEVNVVGTTVMLDALSATTRCPTTWCSPRVARCTARARGSTPMARSSSRAPRSHAQLAAARWDHVDAVRISRTPHRLEGAASTHPNPSSVYGSTKLAQELVLRNWTAAFSVPLSVFRLQNVYGPGQSPHNPYTGIITLFHRLASRGEILDVYEDGDIDRDFVVIDDVVSALLAGIDQPPAADRPRILDVGNGEVTTIADAARMIAAHHGAPEPQVSGKFRDGDVRLPGGRGRPAVGARLDVGAGLRGGQCRGADYLRERGFLG